jgi:hypothetical protein
MGQRGTRMAELVLSDGERDTLARWARRHKSAQALALRCRIVLACAEGGSNTEVAQRLGVSRMTVGSGGPGLSCIASMVCMTSPARADPARSATTTWCGWLSRR